MVDYCSKIKKNLLFKLYDKYINVEMKGQDKKII